MKLFDRDLVLDFFWKFSAFEHALKTGRYLTVGKDKTAEPDWRRFGREIRGQFGKISTPEFRRAVDKLQRIAPQRQIVREGQLGWEPVIRGKSDSEEEFTLRLLKTARNNLFHGGKYPEGPIDEIERNQDILRAALTILNGCSSIVPTVNR